MKKPAANEMVTPRGPGMGPFFERGKVTARYTVHVTKTTTLECVRVHSFPGHGVVHLSLSEFHRLFKPAAAVRRAS